MRKILLSLAALFVVAAPLFAQPGQRIALTNLQKATVVESSRAGQFGLTNSNGDQRYAQFTEIDLTPILYTPTATGNTQNYSEFVTVPGGDIWYIDWQGRAIKIYSAAAATGDLDWLEIDTNTPPNNIADSMYTKSYASFNARMVWPGANVFVNDSINSADVVIQGNRQARLGLFNLLNGAWTDYVLNGGEASILLGGGATAFTVATAGGTPTGPSSGVNHFQVNAADSTIRMHQYPSNRRDAEPVENFLYTDPSGIVRSRGTASLPGAAIVYQSPTCDPPAITPNDSLGPFLGWNTDCLEQWGWNGIEWVLTGSPGGGGGIAEPANQVVYGTGTGVDSDPDLKRLNDTLLINQGQLKVKSTGNGAKIIIDSRRPLLWPGSQTGVDAIIMQFSPPVDRDVTKRDTSPNFYLWQEYSKYHQFQTGDHVFGMGMNLGPGNQKITPGFPAIGFSIENWYQPILGDTTGLSEFNFTWLPKNGGLKRIFSFSGNNTTGSTNALFVTSSLETVNASTGKRVFLNTGGQFEFLGSDATGGNARPFIYLTDQRNPLKRSVFVADTATLSVAAQKFFQIGVIDAAGWIELGNRLNNTRLQFGATNSDTRTFFNTESAASGNYYGGGSILLGGYCSLSKLNSNGYGAVGSNYYLANGNGPGSGLCRAGADVANGIEFANNTWSFWNAPTGAANSTISKTVRATINANGWLAVASPSAPAYTIDAGNSTDAIRIPNGSTAQTPSPSIGLIRLNTTTSKMTVVRTGITPDDIMTLQDGLSATSGQFLGWNGSIWGPTTATNIYNSNGTIGANRIATITDRLVLQKTTDAGSGFQPLTLRVGGNDAGFFSMVSPVNGDSLYFKRINNKGYLMASDENIVIQNTEENIGFEIDKTSKSTIISGGIATNSSSQQDITTTPANINPGIHTVILQPGAGTANLPEIGTGAGQVRPGSMIWVTNFSGGTGTIAAFSGEQIQTTTSVTLANLQSAWVKAIGVADWAILKSN